MSRIGKQPVKMPAGVETLIKESTVTIKGPKGELKKEFPKDIKVALINNELIVTRPDNSTKSKALHGLVRNLLVNMIKGVTKGFEKQLEIVGVGYRAQAVKNKITLSLGFSHPIEYKASEDIEFVIDKEKKNIITIKGINKQTVGEVAAKIRSYKKPEPYKGKGIKYIDEQIQRKAGKAASAGPGAATT
ncbi:MAG: 50S ribosomal protein L6 [Candidatus Gracilibacteria bacterium]|jgi:large subunit ribosomal protein L6